MNNEGTWRLAPGLNLPPDVLAEVVRLCVKNSEYNFTAGGHGTSFVDIDEMFSASPADTRAVDSWLQEAARKIRNLAEEDGYTVLAFVERPSGPVGALAAKVALSEAAKLPSMVVRPHKRLLAQAIKPFRSLTEGRVLLVTDVATSGTSTADAARLLWKVGARRVGALALVDREESAEQFLRGLGMDFHFVMRPPAADAATV